MVICLALLLARCCCCCIFVLLPLLLLSANVVVANNRNIGAAIVPVSSSFHSSSNTRASRSTYGGNARTKNTDPCFLSHPAAPHNCVWTQLKKPSDSRGQLSCECHLNIPQPDGENLIQLNLSFGSLSDMRRISVNRQQHHERRTKTTSRNIPLAAVPTSNLSPVTASVPSYDDNNSKGYSGPDASLTNLEEDPSSSSPSVSSGHSQTPTATHRSSSGISTDTHSRNESRRKVTNRTSAEDSRHKSEESASYIQAGNSDDQAETNLHLQGNLNGNYSSGEDTSDGVSNDGDGIHSKDRSSSSESATKNVPSTLTVKSTTDSALSEDHSETWPEPSSVCVLKLIVQSPYEKHPQTVCLGTANDDQWVQLPGLIYYYRDALNVTLAWDPSRLASAIHLALTYTMVPAADVKCSVLCSNSHLCLLESQLCDNRRDCPDGADEMIKECILKRPSPAHPQHDQSTVTIALIVISVAVVLVLLVCGYVLLRRNNMCQLSTFHTRDTLLRQQQRPHSHSSEMYRSPSGSMQDSSGQYDQRVALLHDRHHHHHQAPSSRSHASALTQSSSSPHTGAPMTHNHQPSSTLPSLHQPSPLSPYFQPSQSSFTPFNGSNRQGQSHFLSQGVSKSSSPSTSSSRSPHTYPHHIALSRDGEEGYKASKQGLHSSLQQNPNWLAQNEVFRAPPNKTIYDRDSPPPPYSFSAPPASTMSPELLVPSMNVVSIPRLGVCNNNNNNKHNNNNTNKCRAGSSPQSARAPRSPHMPTTIYPPGSLSASGPPPDYHQVALTFPIRGRINNSSNLSAPLSTANQASSPPNVPPGLTSSSPPSPPSSSLSSEGHHPLSPVRPSPIYGGRQSVSDHSNTFVVTDGSPSVCPGPDVPVLSHLLMNSENGRGDHCLETVQEGWLGMAVLPSPSCLTSSHVPVLPTPSSLSSESSPPLPSFSCQLDSGLQLVYSAGTAAELENPGSRFSNNNNYHHINNNNNNNNDENYYMKKITIGHCNDTISNNGGDNDNVNNNNIDTYAYCNNNNNSSNNDDVECFAYHCGISSDDSLPRLTLNKVKVPPLQPITFVTTLSPTATSHDTVTNTTTSISPQPLSSSLSSSHHQHPKIHHHHHPVHNQPACQPQPSWHEASSPLRPSSSSHQVSLDPVAAPHHCSTSKPLPLPSPPTAVTNSEFDDHVPEDESFDMVACSEPNGNVFLSHTAPLSALTTASPPMVAAHESDPNGNNSADQTARDISGLPSSPSSSAAAAQICQTGVAVKESNENCDRSKSEQVLSTSPLVSSSSVNPCVDSTPCCDNTSAATATITDTASSSSSPSSSPTSGMQPVSMGLQPFSGNNDVRFVENSGNRRRPVEDPVAAMEDEEEEYVAGVVVAAQERVE